MSETNLCQLVDDAIVDVLDGTAPAALFDHIAECDACRDKKHDAQRAAELVSRAGADFRAPEDFEARLLSAIDAHGGHATSGQQAIAARLDAELGPPVESAPRTERMDTAPSASAPIATTGDTKVDAHAPTMAIPVMSEEAVRTQPGPITAPRSGSVSADTGPRASAPRPAEVVALPAPPPPRQAASRGIRRPAFAASAIVAAAAAAAFGFYMKGRAPHDATSHVDPKAPWSGAIANVSRAASDKGGGVEVCNKGKCAPADKGAAIGAGSVVKTDARTRARLTLEDGSEISLDRATELEIGKSARDATLARGTVVADVAHVEGSTARLHFPGGDVDVIGTKLALTAVDDRASVEVARGEVVVRSGSAKPVNVRAGEEATILRGGETTVASSTSIADTMEWSDKSAEEVDSPVLRGFGELRAKKPGTTKEKDHAVRLAKHATKVRVVDLVARTEVDETFTNDTDEELEGIFRFPLPPGAQIERLALEVDGKLVEGAFVDRDRGAAIWRGVIQNAAPKAPKPKEEIIWVPGPWRDPALLEWQKGGRFELKIFPIPKKGSRRVVLAYTQTVEQAAGVRRFTLPFAHDTSGTTKIGSFDLDVQVIGADKATSLQTRGYELASASGGEGERRTMHANEFVPSGDLTIEYALPDRDKEVTAWAYQPATSITNTPAQDAKKTPEQRAADEAANAIQNDKSPYVALAIRPKLPRWKESKERVHAIVVDASRSMVGERFARATHLASSIVREMDRRDTFVVLACDTTCRPMGEGVAPKPQAPGAAAAQEVERFLGQIEPDGGSDLAASVSAARSLAGSLGGKELRVVYLGDGTPTVGPTKPAHLESAVRSTLPGGDAAVVAVALGADADTVSLQALARGGGGVLVPYVPGQRVATAALDVLAAAYGEVLRDPEIELPAGLAQVTPAHLDPIRAGGETIVVARMNGGEITGSVKLKGRVAGEKFEQSYPVKVIASSRAGNAFVPRLYAAAKIAELEREGSEASKPTAIALSRTFQVASRFTSLLVLESETMFKAFGVDHDRAGANADAFTGEQGAESSSADGDVAVAGEAEPDTKAHASAGKGSAAGGGGLGFGSGHGRLGGSHRPKADVSGDDEGAASRSRGPAPAADKPAPAAEAKAAEMPPASPPPPPPRPAPGVAQAQPAPAASAAPAPMEKQKNEAPQAGAMRSPPAKKRAVDGGDAWSRREEERARDLDVSRRRRGMVPMKKVFDRKVAFDNGNSLASANTSKLIAAEAAFRAAPDSRDKTIDLFALYATSGRVGDAQELTARWAGRDALDPDALLARADLAARQGDRARAVRILGGLVDVRPNDKVAQARLADLHDAAGEPARACEHRITLAEIAPADVKLVAAAVRCSRAVGLADLASKLEQDTPEKARAQLDRELANAATKAQAPMIGDVQVTAEWTGAEDLDIALIDAQGRRTSWLGSPVKNALVATRDVTSPGREQLAIANLPQGSYLVEISRAAGGDSGAPVRGDVTLRVGNETRKVPFALTGARAEVGTVRVSFTSRLVPADSVPSGGWRR